MELSVQTDREKMAKYQAELLRVLHEETNLSVVQQEVLKLRKDLGLTGDRCNPEPRFLDAAMELTKKWAVPKSKS